MWPNSPVKYGIPIRGIYSALFYTPQTWTASKPLMKRPIVRVTPSVSVRSSSFTDELGLGCS